MKCVQRMGIKWIPDGMEKEREREKHTQSEGEREIDGERKGEEIKTR